MPTRATRPPRARRPWRRRWRLAPLVGGATWAGLLTGAVLLLSSPGVRGPLLRTGRALLGLPPVGAVERTFLVADARGVEPGAPVFAEQGAPATPVGYVERVEGDRLTLRLSPGGPAPTLTCLPPSRSWPEALALALPPAASARLATALEERLARTFREALLPAVEARLPAFLARVDPRADAATRALLAGLSETLLARLTPLLEGLTQEVSDAVDARFDLLDRLGLLWKLVRGDAAGLRRSVLPVAREVAAGWWGRHAEEVVRAVGQGLEERRDSLRAWLTGPAWEAARDELLRPTLAEARGRLAAEVEGLAREALEEVALAPGGGFRPRFASVLRTHLLGRGQALLLLGAPGER